MKLIDIYYIQDMFKPSLAQIYLKVFFLSKATTSQLSGGHSIMEAYTGTKPLQNILYKTTVKSAYNAWLHSS